MSDEEYKAEIIKQMKVFGADENEIAKLVTDKLVKAMRAMEAQPKDVAWALMQ